jgi:hypothetical protein
VLHRQVLLLSEHWRVQCHALLRAIAGMVSMCGILLLI